MRRCGRRRPAFNRPVLGLCVAVGLRPGLLSQAKHLLDSIIIVVGEFLAGFSFCDPVAVLRLRNSFGIGRKARIGSAPALDSFWQMRDCFLERRRLLLLRLFGGQVLLYSL